MKEFCDDVVYIASNDRMTLDYLELLIERDEKTGKFNHFLIDSLWDSLGKLL